MKLLFFDLETTGLRPDKNSPSHFIRVQLRNRCLGLKFLIAFKVEPAI